jgi:hypothetical protein
MATVRTMLKLPQRIEVAGMGRHAGGKMKPVPKGGMLQRKLRHNQLEHNKLLSLGIDLRKLPKGRKKSDEQVRKKLKAEGKLEKPWKKELEERKGETDGT